MIICVISSRWMTQHENAKLQKEKKLRNISLNNLIMSSFFSNFVGDLR